MHLAEAWHCVTEDDDLNDDKMSTGVTLDVADESETVGCGDTSAPSLGEWETCEVVEMSRKNDF